MPSEQGAIARRAGIVGLGTLASRVLGLVRDIALAAVFTLSQTDAFWVAFTIPNALRQLLAEGAVSSAVLPVLTKVRETRGDDEARLFFARVRGLSLTALVLVSIALSLGAPWVVELFAGGAAARPGQLERTILLTQWLAPYIFFMGSAALGMAALHTFRRFVVASFAPALLNVALVLAALLLPSPLREAGLDPALALAWGALAGGALQVLAQIPSLRAIGFAGLPRFTLSDPDVREVLKRIGPMTLGLGIYAIDLVVCRRLLSGLGEGAQSWFSWAQRLCDFPQGIFVMALSAATLPSLASLAAKNDLDELASTYAFGMRLALFVAIPVTVLFAALGEPIVVAIFQRGAFDATSAHQTALALAAQGAGLWTVAAVRQLVPVFFSLGDTRTPVIVSAIDLVALIVIAWLITPSMGHVGVSLAVSGSSAVQMLCLWVALRRKLPDLKLREIGASVVRTLIASIIAGVGGGGLAMIVARNIPNDPFFRLVPAIVGGIVFGLLFLVAAWGARSSELEVLIGAVRRKIKRRAA